MFYSTLAFLSNLTLVTLGTLNINRTKPAELHSADTLAQFPPVLQNPAAFLEAFEARYIASGSMEPTLEVGDKLIIDKHTYRSASPQRGDIIIYLPPPQISESSDPRDASIHRIVGLPGEVVEVREGKVLVNEESLDEPYLVQSDSIDYEYGPEKIPQDAYFVLGDNRNNAFDSHIWGMLPGELIMGQAIGIYCPVERQVSLDVDVESARNQEIFEQIVDFFQANPTLCRLQSL